MRLQRSDVIAGLSVAGLMLPEAVAYAGIAGLPPQRAILAGIAGALAYSLVGRSRFAVAAPTSSSAAILAASLGALSASGDTKLMLATLVVAMVGLMFLIASLLRLGALTGFISRAVLSGFAFGLAVTIIAKQLPEIAGVHVEAPNIFMLLGKLAEQASRWNPSSISVGLLALLALLLLQRLRVTGAAAIVLAGGIASSALLGLADKGVALVGPINIELGFASFGATDWQALVDTAGIAAPLVLILFAESWGAMRTLALRHGDTVEPNRELAAMGIANLASAAAQGMPVGTGLSTSSAAEMAGAQSRAAGAFAALSFALIVAFLSGWVALLPQPVLAAVVIAALVHSLNPAPILRLWRLGRDQYIALGAAFGVLVLGVFDGMLLAILLSLVALIERMAAPRLVPLGRLGEDMDFVDAERHPETQQIPGVAIWSPTGQLFFANAEQVLSRVAKQQAANSSIRSIILSLEGNFDLDSTTLDALTEFDAQMRGRGIELRLARVRDGVIDLLRKAGADDLAARSGYSVDAALALLPHYPGPGSNAQIVTD